MVEEMKELMKKYNVDANALQDLVVTWNMMTPKQRKEIIGDWRDLPNDNTDFEISVGNKQ